MQRRAGGLGMSTWQLTNDKKALLLKKSKSIRGREKIEGREAPRVTIPQRCGIRGGLAKTRNQRDSIDSGKEKGCGHSVAKRRLSQGRSTS